MLFGPYFIRNRPYNSDEYQRILGEEVFPEIRGVIGDAAWNAATWMQVFGFVLGEYLPLQGWGKAAYK